MIGDIEIGYVSKARSLKTVRERLSIASVVGIDTETTGLDPLTDRIRLIQIATMDYVFVLDMYQLPKKKVAEILEDLLHDPTVIKIMHNSVFDLEFIHQEFGFGLNTTNLFDTMLAHFLIQGGDHRFRHSLDSLCINLLSMDLPKDEQVSNWDGNLYKEQIQYAGLDAFVLLPLYRKLITGIRNNSLARVAKLEFDTVPAVASMELNGFKVDKVKWRDNALIAKEDREQLEEKTIDLLGVDDINLNAPLQVAKALSNLGGMEIKSVAKAEVKYMIEHWEVRKDLFGNSRDIRPALIAYQSWKAQNTMYNNFGTAFLSKHLHKDGRMHPSIHQLRPNTGRFSYSRPNLQQMPKTKEFRSGFIAEEGNKLITIDYSQIELRILADITQEESLLKAFNEGRDIHTEVARKITGKKKVTKSERDFAKIINYGTPYGMGATTMSALLNVSFDEAKKAKAEYMRANPAIGRWFRDQQSYFKQHNCVRTASGRLRRLDLWHLNDDKEFEAVQASKNFPIQGTNADITKLALARLYRELDADAKLVNCVHDEIVVECPDKIAKGVYKEMQRIMIEAGEEFISSVPVLADGEISDTWSK